MKIPMTPPKLDALMEAAERAGRFGEIFFAMQDSAIDSRYFHWDELRHRPPPEGLTSKEWWLAVMMRRSSQFCQIPLKDTKGVPFRYATPDPTQERLHDVDFLVGGTLKDADPLTNPAMKDQYLLRSLREEAITSSLIEGAATTREKARELLRTGRKPRDHAERMIVNNYVTMQYLTKLRDRELSSNLVCEIHRLITKGTLEDSNDEGRFRAPDRPIDIADNEGNVFHVPPGAGELPERMRAMCEFANARHNKPFLHPVLRAIILHFWLAYDHPFVDGNGRTARALFYWSMLRSDYWLAEFISISSIILNASGKYGTAFLHTETDNNDLTYFILYHLDVLRRAIDELYSYIRRKTRELQYLEREMKGAALFNDRQCALLAHALKHPNREYTVNWHRGQHGTAHQTARTDLLELAEKGLMNKRKVGRQWRFTPVADLDERLRK